MSEFVLADDDIDEVRGFQLRQIIKHEMLQNAMRAKVWKGAYISAMYPVALDEPPAINIDDTGRISARAIRYGGFCQAIMAFSRDRMEEVLSSAKLGQNCDYFVENSAGFYSISLKSWVKDGIFYLYGACSECGPDSAQLRRVTDVDVAV